MLAQHCPAPRSIAALMLLACVGCARGESELWPAGFGAGSTAPTTSCRAVLAPEQIRVEPVAPQPRLPTPLPPLPQRLDERGEEATSWSEQPVRSASDQPAPGGDTTTGARWPEGAAPMALQAKRNLDGAFGRLDQATQAMRPALAEVRVDHVPRPTRLPSAAAGTNVVHQPQDRPAVRAANQPPAVSPWTR